MDFRLEALKKGLFVSVLIFTIFTFPVRWWVQGADLAGIEARSFNGFALPRSFSDPGFPESVVDRFSILYRQRRRIILTPLLSFVS